ncbi:uncharacterized protein LOC114530728 [Dendronephthya gigantea]|uniref:uncharacterized protein LOC114530728 n=1 Tax=Dendronephthya gigantea TaxID=151771 RepID=UPI00106C2F48|nr:uncharacterized protein LOC114530728 [Dendronephthya gigantea]XP_028408137.1 uncharacterized protein LOC114530728 [Dendronephthya gigantea]
MDSNAQIVQILEEIKQNTKSIRNEICPSPRENKVFVSVRIKFKTVGDIDNIHQHFYANFVLTLKWKEPLLRGKEQKDVVWNEQWDPRVNFKNQLTVDKLKNTHELIYEPNDNIPTVKMNIFAAGTFKKIFDLRYFPYDYQSLCINLDSDWPVEVMSFEKSDVKDSITVDTFTGCHEWKLYPHVVASIVEQNEQEEQLSGTHRKYPNYKIKCHVERIPNFYLLNIVIIVFSILGLTFCSFAVDISSLDVRLNVTLTLLLTLVAFKFVVSQRFPNVSYLTRLDEYILFCMIIQCLIAVAHVIGEKVSEKTKVQIFPGVLGVLAVLMHFYFGIEIWRKVKEMKAYLKRKTDDYESLIRKEEQGRRISKLEDQQTGGTVYHREEEESNNREQVGHNEDIELLNRHDYKETPL